MGDLLVMFETPGRLVVALVGLFPVEHYCATPPSHNVLHP